MPGQFGQVGWQEKESRKGLREHPPGSSGPAPAPPLPAALLTLGGLLGCLGPLHLCKHVLTRTSHQGQVGIDADLSILLGVLV